jgi:hypothetical protein
MPAVLPGDELRGRTGSALVSVRQTVPCIEVGQRLGLLTVEAGPHNSLLILQSMMAG